MKKTGTMEITSSTTLKGILNENLFIAGILDRHDIDYGNFGALSLADICERYGISKVRLLGEIKKIAGQKNLSWAVEDWDVSLLCNFIKVNLHKIILDQINSAMPILTMLRKGERIKSALLNLMNQFFEDLDAHIRKEQRMLYPHILFLNSACEDHEQFSYSPFGSVSSPVKVLKNEHLKLTDSVNNLIRLLKILCRKNQEEKKLNALYSILNSLSDDLRMHIHFENNLLFPKAIKLEKSLERRSKINSTHKQ